MNTGTSYPAQRGTAQMRPQAAPAREAASISIWPIVIMLYAVLMPREFRLEFAGLVFFADRMVAFAMLPLLLRAIFSGALKLRVPDLIILAAAGWMVLSMMQNYGFTAGLERGGALALDATIGYFLARVCIRNVTDFQRVLILFAPGLLIAGLSMVAESLTARRIVQPIAEAIFGRLPIYLSGEAVGFAENREQYRLGLMRASGPFPHPILGGLFLASALSLYFWSGLRGWPRTAGVIAAVCGFFSLSSAAILGLIMSAGFIAYDFIQNRMKELSWGLLALIALAGGIVIQVLSQGGIVYVIVRYLTLNPATGYFRQLIWEYGVNSVSGNPIFGIGFEGYERPVWMLTESIDAHWLLLAIRFGIPGAVLMFALSAWSIYVVSRASSQVLGLDRRTLRALAITMGVLLLMAFTVALNGGIHAWFLICTGAGISIAAGIQNNRHRGTHLSAEEHAARS